MRAAELCDAIKGQFAADSDFTGVTMLADATSETIARPCLIFDLSTKALNDTGKALVWSLTVWVESAAEKKSASDDSPDEVHAELVEFVRDKFHGTGKAALLTALNGENAFSWRGWSATESDPGAQSNHLRTPLGVTGTVIALVFPPP